MFKQITSSQNKEVKWLLQLQEKSRNRRKEELFIVEGIREIKLAIKGGYLPLHFYFIPEMINFQEVVEMAKSNENEPAEITEVSQDVYEKVAYRGSTEGLIAVFRSISRDLKNLSFNN